MNERLRCFVAVALPAPLREAVGELLRSPAARLPGVAWVRPELLHLTLKFLGDVDADLVPAAAAALAPPLARCSPFTLRLQGAGAFPSPRRPRVIWIGVARGAAELAAVAAAVEGALAPLGFPPEGRPFAAHLTIGRVKAPPRDPAALPAFLGEVDGRFRGELLVPAVHLVRSELFPAGPRYSILRSVSLGATPPAEERAEL
jgi:2'-5' RNA ligase